MFLGPGTQHMSRVAIDDLLGIIHHALDPDDLEGPVNAVAPSPVTNEEFTETLGRVLASTRVNPERLVATG